MRFSVLIERDPEGVLVATVPALPGCHTQAKTMDELMARVDEAIRLYLEVHPAEEKQSELLGVQFIEVTQG